MQRVIPYGFPTIVALCGSCRFKEQFFRAGFRESMLGRIVLNLSWYGTLESYNPTPEEKIALDALHFRRIDLSDEILVIDRGGYIGESTRNEIEYADATGKPVRYCSKELCRRCNGRAMTVLIATWKYELCDACKGTGLSFFTE